MRRIKSDLPNDELFDGYSADEVFLDNALERWGSTRAVPYAVRIDDRDGAIFADTKTIRLGTIDLAVLRKIEFD